MARKRIISPEIWASRSFAELSDFAKIVFIGLISNADDEGRGEADPALLKSTLFPRDEKKRVADVKSALSEIARSTSTLFYSVEGHEYYALTKWKLWQKLDRPKPSKLPAPPKEKQTSVGERGSYTQNRQFDDGSKINRRTIDDGSTIEWNMNTNKNKKREYARARETPTVEQITEYCRERQNQINPQRFFDYYQGVGWTINGQPICDWRAVVRRWETNGVDGECSAHLPIGITESDLNAMFTQVGDEDDE